VWLGRQQVRSQIVTTLWCTLYLASIAAIPAGVGMAVQAVVDGSGARLLGAGGVLLGLGALTALGDTMTHRTAVTNWITVAARVQQLLARKASELGAVLTRRVAAGEVVAVSTGDVEKIGWFVETSARFFAAVLACLVVSVGLVFYQPMIGIAVAAGVPVLALAVLPLLGPAQRRAEVQREKSGRATELAADTVAGLRVLRGIGGEELFLTRYRQASQEVRGAAVSNARMWALIAAVQVVLPGLFLVAVVWFGVRLVTEGTITVGELVTCYGCISFLLMPLRQFEETAAAWTFSRASANRAARVLGLRRSADPAGSAAATATVAVDADAAAPSGDLYDPLTGFLAHRGEFTAVVCGNPDEAGRLADRLGGHPVHGVEDADDKTSDDKTSDAKTAQTAGSETETDTPSAVPSVLLGGTALDDLPLIDARAVVLVQDKDPVLLSGTLSDLLDVPSDGGLTAEDVLTAAQCGDVLDALAQASVDDSEDPMRTRITERGRSLSGGQRQRLALARSLMANPQVLVLDEPTSAVDAHTEARIADGLRRIRTDRTTVVFSSSPLLLDRADRVVFVPDGTATASGSHRELLNSNSAYRAVVTREEEDDVPVGTTAELEGRTA
jgi:putative ABC transport system ATP-binding protein